ncbi:MAG: sn-glycerol-3-phosphate ABC transporter ATP-binding protein UgpC [Elusimicrobiota bacterium]|jgi:multiple sugar transport system ATP-binding protein|nr:sn-glycerol-3-phosphate ABC transporter ATP-binding protein UgpC [Elusimicrobiota bacterium]
MAQIIFENVTKIYPNNVKVIENLNLHFEDKEFIVLLGPSGCGKSTILRMIAGLESITSGKLFIGQKIVNDVAPKDRDIAMVFQSYALYPHMSVYKNMAFSLMIKKMPKEEIDKKVKNVAKILELTPFLDRKPNALSGGQRQRVALGRAMVRNPSVFLLDEPLSNLDAKLRTSMRKQISLLHKQLQTTFVYVTHDQTEAMTMADRIVVIKQGQIQQFDKPQVLYDKPANIFVAGFVGSPAMNFIEGELVCKDGKFWCVNENLTIDLTKIKCADKLPNLKDKKIIFGIRPEDISLSAADQKDGETFKASVLIAERTGAEVYLHLVVSNCEINSRVGSNADVKFGDKIYVKFDISKAHLFDSATGKAI